jgi:hypothetical protein
MKTTEISKLKIFLCHASEDKEKVRELYLRLSENDYDLWIDEENILPGQNWRFEISKAVKESHVVIVCLSNKSVIKSGFVQKEIRYALDQADEQPENFIFVIPLKLEECDVPQSLSKWHWVNYFEIDGHERLLNALKQRCVEIEIVDQFENKVPSSLLPLLKLFRHAYKTQKILDWKDFDWVSNSRRELIAYLDDKEKAFALKCSLQHGKNIPFWCKINSKNPCSIESIKAPILENYGRRPLLRSGFAMENLTKDLKQEVYDSLSETIETIKNMGNEIPFKIVNAAMNQKTLELWKNNFFNDSTYGSIIKQLIQEVSEPIN